MTLEEELTAPEEAKTRARPAPFACQQPAPATPTEREADVVADDRGSGRNGDHDLDGEPLVLGGEDADRDQARLAGER